MSSQRSTETVESMETTASAPADIHNRFERVGEGLALAGVVAPLLFIGGLKFTPVEIEALKPLISGTPWLAWLYPLFGEAGASYALGIFEILAALMLVATPWSARIGLVGGALATVTFLVTCTLFFAPLPVWDDRIGGFPALGPLGQFLIKDIALLGISLAITGRCLARIQRARVR